MFNIKYYIQITVANIQILVISFLHNFKLKSEVIIDKNSLLVTDNLVICRAVFAPNFSTPSFIIGV